MSFYEDPGISIPESITILTGITDDMVRGQAIDLDVVSSIVERCQLVIAHNASFDRPFLERRVPHFATKHWACSMKDIPWQQEGFRQRSLEWLGYRHCGVFYDAHRADSDCYMGVHLLATPLPSGTLAMTVLLTAARKQYERLWAIAAEFSARQLLKDRGYEWSNGDDGRPKAWFRDVPAEEVAEELEWLGVNAYMPARATHVRRDPIDRQLRFSDRIGVPRPKRVAGERPA